MKNLTIILVIAVLGIATLSCNDQEFTDVEQTVLKEKTLYVTDGTQTENEDVPGSD